MLLPNLDPIWYSVIAWVCAILFAVILAVICAVINNRRKDDK